MIGVLQLRELRKQKGLTMKQLGKIVGVGESAISQYENGKRQPDYDILNKLADYFGVSVDYLLGRTDVPNPAESPLDGVEFAFYGEIKDLTDEEREDLADFVKYLKSKRKDD